MSLTIKKYCHTIAFSLLLLCGGFGLSSCSLILEPENKAIEKMFSACAVDDMHHAREMCDGEQICASLAKTCKLIASEWYNARKGFFEVVSIERNETRKRSYVKTNIRLPAGAGLRETTVELVFEMERIQLNWHIYSVERLDEFNRRAERARGIL